MAGPSPGITDNDWLKTRQSLRTFLRDHDPRKNLDAIPRAEPDTIWIRHDPIYERWRFDPNSPVLWITGPPACGKSVIARHLIEEDLRSETGPRTCYHFFSSNDKGKQDAVVVAARSILGQLLGFDSDKRILPTFEALREPASRDLPGAYNPSPDGTELARVPVVCVLDGPDEAIRPPEEIEAFGEFLDAMMREDHGYDIKLLITCRPVYSILEERHKGRLIIRLENHKPQFDKVLYRYIERKLDEFHGQPRVKRTESVLQQIHERADCSFLAADSFVEFVIDRVMDGFDILFWPLGAFPNPLKRIFLSALGHMDQLALRILSILAVAARPLTRDELTAAVCLEELEEDATRSTIDCRCQGLIAANERNDFTLPPCFGVHRFVLDFVSGYMASTRRSELHQRLAQRCMEYIELSVDNRPSSAPDEITGLHYHPRLARHPFLTYAAEFWSFHANESFLPQGMPRLGEYTLETRAVVPSSGDEVLRLDKLPPFWEKAVSFCNPTSDLLKSWFPLYWAATYPSETLPNDFANKLLVSEFIVASYLNFGRVMEVMAVFGTPAVQYEADICNRRNLDQQTTLHVASRYGRLNAVVTLAKLCKEPSTFNLGDHEGQTALHLATKCRHAAVVEALIGVKVTNINATDLQGQTPLHYAAQWGDERITDNLLNANASVDMEDHRNYTPIMCARSRLEEIQSEIETHPSRTNEVDERAHVYNLLEKAEVTGTKVYDFLDPRRSRVDRAFDIHAVTFGSAYSSRTSSRYSVETFLGAEGREWLRENVKEPKWLHVPANNMMWIEVLIKQFESDVFSIGTRDEILRREAWADCLHQGSSRIYHSTFMKPQCGLVKLRSRSAAESNNTPHDLVKTSFCLYMPYIHWEKDAAVREMAELLSPFLTDGILGNADFEFSRYEAVYGKTEPQEITLKQKLLVDYYLNCPSPVHNRRTLDQYRYYNLADTRGRDKDQLFSRVVHEDNRINPLLMVDQLWLWCLPDGTIITSFPGRWTSDEKNSGRPEEYHGKTNVLRNIKLKLRNVRSPESMICLAVSECLKACFDTNRKPGTFPNILETYSNEIGRIVSNSETRLCVRATSAREIIADMVSVLTPISPRNMKTDKEASLFKTFTEDVKALDDRYSRNQAVNIVDPVKEMGLLREIKDIVDELHTMEEVFVDQIKVLGDANSKLWRFTVIGENGLESQAQSKWLHLSALVSSRRDEVKKMKQQAMGTSQALNDLIDLKQKFSNVLEARWARTMAEEASRQAEETARQGTTLMVFTSVTIIFLPLSFMAAFFALDVAQFPKNEAGQLDLGFVSQYIFAISAVVVVPLLLLAFNFNRIRHYNQLAKASILDMTDLIPRSQQRWRRKKNRLGRVRGELSDNDTISSSSSYDGRTYSLSLAKLLLWIFIVLPVSEVRFACLGLLILADKIGILSLRSSDSTASTRIKTTANTKKTSSSSSDSSTTITQSPAIRPEIRWFLRFTLGLLRIFLIPFWLSILSIVALMGGFVYLVLSVLLQPNPLTRPVERLFDSTLFTLTEERGCGSSARKPKKPHRSRNRSSSF